MSTEYNYYSTSALLFYVLQRITLQLMSKYLTNHESRFFFLFMIKDLAISIETEISYLLSCNFKMEQLI